MDTETQSSMLLSLGNSNDQRTTESEGPEEISQLFDCFERQKAFANGNVPLNTSFNKKEQECIISMIGDLRFSPFSNYSKNLRPTFSTFGDLKDEHLRLTPGTNMLFVSYGDFFICLLWKKLNKPLGFLLPKNGEFRFLQPYAQSRMELRGSTFLLFCNTLKSGMAGIQEVCSLLEVPLIKKLIEESLSICNTESEMSKFQPTLHHYLGFNDNEENDRCKDVLGSLIGDDAVVILRNLSSGISTVTNPNKIRALLHLGHISDWGMNVCATFLRVKINH